MSDAATFLFTKVISRAFHLKAVVRRYTSFNLSIAATSPRLLASMPLSPTDTLNVTVTVTNTGKADGKTVAAIYFSKPLSKFVRYHKMLGSFAKTPLIKAGGSIAVTLAMPMSAMSAYNLKMQDQQVEPGEYLLTLGQDSEVVEGTVSVTVK